MAPTNEEQIIKQMLKELSGLAEQRDQINAKMEKKEAAIRAFIELLEDETDQELYLAHLTAASKPLGLTESIKRVFREANEALLPMAIRDKLIEAGFPLSGYSNQMAVIYTTMTRLREQGLIEEGPREKGAFTFVATDALKAQAATARKERAVEILAARRKQRAKDSK